MPGKRKTERAVKADAAMRFSIRLRIFQNDKVFGPGVAELMSLVDETGSLSEACRRMEMAYSKGWKIIRRSEKDLGVRLMRGTRGGENGGATELTEEGRDLLRRYTEMKNELDAEGKKLFKKYFGNLRKKGS